MKNILCFGDSLTDGFGLRDPVTESFPSLIQQQINIASLEYNVINGGLSGDTSADGLSRIDYWTMRPISVFILELGINDVIRGISPQTTLLNLQAVINKVKLKYPDVKMALMGMQIPSFIQAQFSKRFMEIYPRLALSNNMAFVPFFLDGVAGIPKLNLPDRLHPSADGYKIIAGKVWPVIKSLLI